LLELVELVSQQFDFDLIDTLIIQPPADINLMRLVFTVSSFFNRSSARLRKLLA
jgi:hypothetical protein